MTNDAPCLLAVLMATTVHQSNKDSMAQCNMFRATPEATGCRHWATTRSVSPQRPPGQQANKQQSTNTPAKMAVSVAIAMRRYNTAHISQWRRSRASLEATRCHHQASTCSNSHKFRVAYLQPTRVHFKQQIRCRMHCDGPQMLCLARYHKLLDNT